MKRPFLAAFLLASLLCGPALAETLLVEAGAAPTENILKPVKDAFSAATGVSLIVTSSGPKIAMQNLEAGKTEAAAAGLSSDDWFALMKKEGAEVKDPSAYRFAQIGTDRIAVFLNKANPVSALSKEQLKGIFTGKIDNWQAVGGKDGAIIVVWSKLTGGTNSMFQKKILDGDAVLKEVLEVSTADEVKQNVSANAEAIGFGPAGLVDGAVSSPATPEISRPILLATKGEPAPKVRKLIDFIKGDGKKLLKGQ